MSANRIDVNMSTVSEVAIAYALLTCGTNPAESPIMRSRMVDAMRELGHPDGADEIEASFHSVKV